ncbi:MAG TPA: pantetheine-phosphate adenylyltransferase [Actinobacteria bacterium]|nr:pantetheine-phosphate adenylyltransferase [Actinomycetota bacterium]
MQIAVCPGSFDPVTNGHLDIIGRAARLFDKVVVGVFESMDKKPLFSLEERVKYIQLAVEKDLKLDNVEVESFETLLVEFAQKHGASAIIKGLRAVSDFEHEFQMTQFNQKLDPSIETVFMIANTQYGYLSSSAVKEIAMFGGCVEGLVTSEVREGLRKVFQAKKGGH